MNADERIQAHIVTVWREANRFFSIGGREGMIVLTEKHFCFVIKTEAKMKWWQNVVPRQTIKFLQKDDIMIMHDGYSEKDLRNDLENKKNMEISFDDIIDIKHEAKVWGGVLHLEIEKENKKLKYQFSVVQDWVKYPAKAPMNYMKVDWTPLVNYIKERQKFTV